MSLQHPKVDEAIYLKKMCDLLNSALRSIDRKDTKQAKSQIQLLQNSLDQLMESSNISYRKLAAVIIGVSVRWILTVALNCQDEKQAAQELASQGINMTFKGPFQIKDCLFYLRKEESILREHHLNLIEHSRTQQGCTVNNHLIYSYLVQRSGSNKPLIVGLTTDRLFEILANPRLIDCLPDPQAASIAVSLRQGARSISDLIEIISVETLPWAPIKACPSNKSVSEKTVSNNSANKSMHEQESKRSKTVSLFYKQSHRSIATASTNSNSNSLNSTIERSETNSKNNLFLIRHQEPKQVTSKDFDSSTSASNKSNSVISIRRKRDYSRKSIFSRASSPTNSTAESTKAITESPKILDSRERSVFSIRIIPPAENCQYSSKSNKTDSNSLLLNKAKRPNKSVTINILDNNDGQLTINHKIEATNFKENVELISSGLTQALPSPRNRETRKSPLPVRRLDQSKGFFQIRRRLGSQPDNVNPSTPVS